MLPVATLLGTQHSYKASTGFSSPKKKKKKKKKKKMITSAQSAKPNIQTGPDSSSGRASASGSEGRRFDPRPRHTKGVKNGTGSSLADARNKKRVVPGRYKKAGKYLLRIFVMSHNSS